MSAPLKIAFLSHTAMGGDFVVGSHHLSAALAAAGHEVTHISPPVSPAHLLVWRDRFVRVRCRRWLRGGESIKGVRDVVPLTLLPWQLARRSVTLTKAYSQSILIDPLHGRSALSLEDADALIVDEPRFVGLVPASSRQIIVYRPTDLYALMRNDPSIYAVERTLCARADVLVATSEGVAAHLRRLCGRPAHVINNGVDVQHFATAPVDDSFASQLPGRRQDRAVYVGSFDGRFSVAALRAAALALPGKHFILAGPGSAKLASLAANVTALGAIDYAMLPQLLGQCAVGLLPFAADPLNAARSPMKLFEYAAAGLAIAATQASSHQAAMPSLSVAGDENLFADAVTGAFDLADDAVTLDAARSVARCESWTAKSNRLLDLIRGAQLGASDPHPGEPVPGAAQRIGICSARAT